MFPVGAEGEYEGGTLLFGTDSKDAIWTECVSVPSCVGARTDVVGYKEKKSVNSIAFLFGTRLRSCLEVDGILFCFLGGGGRSKTRLKTRELGPENDHHLGNRELGGVFGAITHMFVGTLLVLLPSLRVNLLAVPDSSGRA